MKSSPIFKETLVQGPHKRSFRIHAVPAIGWMASEEADQDVVQRLQFTDWHRVERMVTRFAGEVAALRREGWVDAAEGSTVQ